MTTHPEGLTRPSEKSLEMAREFADEWRTYLDWADDPEALSQFATLLDSRFKDGLKRAAEIAEANARAYVARDHCEAGAAAVDVKRAILMEAGDTK